ncbi:hypothetical protein T440DRAFT_82789 [Plenodomus tracheiphilus IPT5]|uniref:Exonuclease domain-containing protein n=1 Tax=Plenodomus tracheiphilus IPT5 TaxID=1408161 RepID=A0A6A7B5B1_9PLEO|nr:hypothetical protein T440DRAFT_82789 [Plenodomus tracheiphilus IPT5]
MSKRKRGDRDERPVDVGLGATLAHLRGEQSPDTTSRAADDNGEGEWQVVGPSKRRRKARDDQHGNGHRRSTSASPHRSPRRQPDNPEAPVSEVSDTNKPGSGHAHDHQAREERDKERKLQRSYPAIEHSHHARLQSHVKLADLQSLVLYLLADGNAPQWVSVRSRTSIQQVVMLMVPGLELGMFNGEVPLDSTPLPGTISDGEPKEIQPNTAGPNKETALPKRLNITPDDFYPARLRPDRLPACLKPLADIFEHIWPIKAPGEHRNNQYMRVHSPIHTMLTSQIPKTQEEKQMKKSGSHKGPTPQNSKHWENKRTRITEYLATLVEQQENEYVLHPAMFVTPEAKEAARQQRELAKQSLEHGWVDTGVASLEDGEVPEDAIEQGSVTAGRHILSIDCEMCKAENDQLVLTRISLMNWDGTVALDKLVKPEVGIKDYLTQWSGITAAMLQDVTTTLSDIQQELLELITPRTILVGHSLNSDLNAMKLTHPFLVDTGILYPHPRGPPYKQSLKWLAQKYLKREVQKGASGHDSVEDARTCLDLVKQKCDKGPRWGSGDTNAESIFKRLERSVRPKSNESYRSGAVVDWGDPRRGHGGQAQVSVGCKSDDEVVEGISRAMLGQAEGKDGATDQIDFLWGRLRELELRRGWWDDAKTADVEAIRLSALQRLGVTADGDDVDLEIGGSQLSQAVSQTVNRIKQIYESLPRCTAFIVYSGTNDPREIRRLQAMQQQYRREYATKNWDNLSVKWTDTEIQALSRACQAARNGVAFIAVK